jgi:hypothetical protein
LSCTNGITGKTYKTVPISTTSSPQTIKYYFEQTCFWFKDKTTWWDGTTYTSYYDGRDIIVRFNGFPGDPGNITITNVNLVGGNSSATPSIDLSTVVLQQASSNILYEPIPYEWIFTERNTTQVNIWVNGA